MTAIERALAWCKEELRHAEDAEAAAAKHGSDDDLQMAAMTVEEISAMIDALEKQVPTAPQPAFKNKGISWCGVCPECEKVCLEDHQYCSDCGQKLDWPKEGDA